MTGGFILTSATGRLPWSNCSYPPSSLAGSLELSTSYSISPPPLQGNLCPRVSFSEQLNSGSVFQDSSSEPVPFCRGRVSFIPGSVVQYCKYPSWIKSVHHSLPHLQSVPIKLILSTSPFPCCLALYFGGSL